MSLFSSCRPCCHCISINAEFPVVLVLGHRVGGGVIMLSLLAVSTITRAEE